MGARAGTGSSLREDARAHARVRRRDGGAGLRLGGAIGIARRVEGCEGGFGLREIAHCAWRVIARGDGAQEVDGLDEERAGFFGAAVVPVNGGDETERDGEVAEGLGCVADDGANATAEVEALLVGVGGGQVAVGLAGIPDIVEIDGFVTESIGDVANDVANAGSGGRGFAGCPWPRGCGRYCRD